MAMLADAFTRSVKVQSSHILCEESGRALELKCTLRGILLETKEIPDDSDAIEHPAELSTARA